MRSRTIFTIFFLIWGPVLLCAQHPKADTFYIEGANWEPLKKHYLYFEDHEHHTDPKSVLQKYKQGFFVKPDTTGNPAFNIGSTSADIWLYLDIKNINDDSLPLFWSFYNGDLAYTLYDVTDSSRPILMGNTSTKALLKDRPVPVRSITFPFLLEPSQSRSFLLRVTNVNSHDIYFPTDITTDADYLLYEIGNSFEIGAFIGFLFLAFVINLLLGFTLKNKIHFYHSFYVLSLIALIINDYMFDALIYPDWLFKAYGLIPKQLFFLLSINLAIVVFEEFVQSVALFPKFRVFFKMYHWVSALLAALTFTWILLSSNHLGLPTLVIYLNYACIGIGVTVLIVNMIYGLIIKNYNVTLYFVSTLFFILSFILFLANTLFRIPVFHIHPSNLVVSFSFEVLLLTVIFAFKQQKDYQAIAKIQQEALTMKNNVSSQIIEVQEEERGRIAKDLHDDIGSTLSAIQLQLAQIPHSSKEAEEMNYKSKELLSQAILDLRTIVHDLLPQDFSRTDLYTLLGERIDYLNQLSLTKFTMILDGDVDNIQPAPKTLTIYRIINELCNNILKHAKAANASVQLLQTKNDLQIVTEDDGVGFSELKDPNGRGLKNVKNRVNFLKGTLSIDSNDCGTTIIIHIPI